MISKNKILIVIGGPTASGKTKLSIAIAKHFNIEIINADSRQVYKELNIGTAKPTATELDKIKHHFISNVSIFDEYNVGIYEKEVLDFLNVYYETNDIAILSGGTGLYLEAIISGLNKFPDIDTEIMDFIENEYKQNGLNYIQELLKKVDPEYFNSIDIYNHRRIIRALSVIRQSDKKFSSFLKKEKEKRNFQSINICTFPQRENLYNIINSRVEDMFSIGLVDEAKGLHKFKGLKALDTVGYKELFDYFDGLISLEEAKELIKRNSRRYAKRQITWFNNKGEWLKVLPENINLIIEIINEKINQYNS